MSGSVPVNRSNRASQFSGLRFLCLGVLIVGLSWLLLNSKVGLGFPDNEARPVRQSPIQGLIDGGKFEAAESLIRKRLASNRDQYSSYCWLGYLEFRRGQIFASIRNYRQARELRPHMGEVHRLLARNYQLINQLALFWREIKEAIALDPSDQESHYLAGRHAFEIENQFETAADYFEKAILLSPDDYKAHYFLGLSYKAMGRIDDAKAQLLKACEKVELLKVEYDLPFRSLAEISLEGEQIEASLKYCQRAISISPDAAENFYLKGKADFRKGELEDAVSSLKRAISLDPTYARPHYLLAAVYKKLSNPALAREALGAFQEVRDEFGDEGN